MAYSFIIDYIDFWDNRLVTRVCKQALITGTSFADSNRTVTVIDKQSTRNYYKAFDNSKVCNNPKFSYIPKVSCNSGADCTVGSCPGTVVQPAIYSILLDSCNSEVVASTEWVVGRWLLVRTVVGDKVVGHMVACRFGLAGWNSCFGINCSGNISPGKVLVVFAHNCSGSLEFKGIKAVEDIRIVEDIGCFVSHKVFEFDNSVECMQICKCLGRCSCWFVGSWSIEVGKCWIADIGLVISKCWIIGIDFDIGYFGISYFEDTTNSSYKLVFSSHTDWEYTLEDNLLI